MAGVARTGKWRKTAVSTTAAPDRASATRGPQAFSRVDDEVGDGTPEFSSNRWQKPCTAYADRTLPPRSDSSGRTFGRRP